MNIAEKAISYNKTNSYLLDTKGQVFREKLKHNFPTSTSHGYWSVEDGGRIIDLSFKAQDEFHASIEAAKAEYKTVTPGKRRQRLNDTITFQGCLTDDIFPMTFSKQSRKFLLRHIISMTISHFMKN